MKKKVMKTQLSDQPIRFSVASIHEQRCANPSDDVNKPELQYRPRRSICLSLEESRSLYSLRLYSLQMTIGVDCVSGVCELNKHYNSSSSVTLQTIESRKARVILILKETASSLGPSRERVHVEHDHAHSYTIHTELIHEYFS